MPTSTYNLYPIEIQTVVSIVMCHLSGRPIMITTEYKT